jgi:hypothetical protein
MITIGIEAYPLYWPEGWKRAPFRKHSRFQCGFGQAREYLFSEIRRMGGIKPILSANIPLRNDGLPRANQPSPADPGVAVYFTYKKHEMVFACDKFYKATDNIYSIAKTIDALRGIERWGASDMMERAFTGFKALPQQATQAWREVLGIEGAATLELVESRFRTLVKVHHPDQGGDRNKFEEITQAREAARMELSACACRNTQTLPRGAALHPG